MTAELDKTGAGAQKKSSMGYVIVLGVIGAIGGLLFGYDIGVISGALLILKPELDLSTSQSGLLASADLWGAVLGALSAILLTNWLGRRRSNILAGLIFIIGGLVTGCASWLTELLGGSVPVLEILFCGRVIVGLAIGISSVAGPMYISEVSPPHLRGRLVTCYQLAITIGILIAYGIDLAFAEQPNGWHWMFGLAVIPGLILFFGMMAMPYSPRWLVQRGRHDAARMVLAKTMAGVGVDDELDRVIQDVKKTEGHKWWKDLPNPAVKRALLVGIGMAVLQQFIGINAVIYFGPEIFQYAGFTSTGSALMATLGIGAINVLATFIAIAFIDKIGRRPLLIFGLSGMFLSLIVLAGAFHALNYSEKEGPLKEDQALKQEETVRVFAQEFHYHTNHQTIRRGHTTANDKVVKAQMDASSAKSPDQEPATPDAEQRKSSPMLGIATLLCLSFYIICFACSMGPIVWVLISEIFPLHMRNLGASVATAGNWGANGIVALYSLSLMNNLGRAETFGIYAGICFLTLLFVLFIVPETKGYSLEEIEKNFSKSFRRHWSEPSGDED